MSGAVDDWASIWKPERVDVSKIWQSLLLVIRELSLMKFGARIPTKRRG